MLATGIRGMSRLEESRNDSLGRLIYLPLQRMACQVRRHDFRTRSRFKLACSRSNDVCSEPTDGPIEREVSSPVNEGLASRKEGNLTADLCGRKGCLGQRIFWGRWESGDKLGGTDSLLHVECAKVTFDRGGN
jgi:hypothetical protein